MAISKYRVWPHWRQVAKRPAVPWSTWATGPSDWKEPLSGLPGLSTDLEKCLPCVLFDAKPSLEIISVTETIRDLLGVSSDAVIGRASFWQERVLPEDWPSFQSSIAELQSSGAVAFVHRVADTCGLPMWLTHSLRKIVRNGEPIIRGCLVPIEGDSATIPLEQKMVSHFIHKLGNHFQLLNLAVNSLDKSLAQSRESEILHETLEKAIELTRVFSECNQAPSWISEIPLLDSLKAATQGRVSQFTALGVKLESDFENIPEDTTIIGDAYLLDVSLGHLLQNALEATGTGGTVELSARLVRDGSRGAARLHLRDTGCGIPPQDLHQVSLPFYTTKKNHDGLGLTVATRLIEMHGGALRIDSREGWGTLVEVSLPLGRSGDVF